MDKFGRVLVIIFFLCLFNLGLNLYVLSKLNKPVTQTLPATNQPSTRNTPQGVPSAQPTTSATIQSDLTVIKAELRALRESLESADLILQTPEP